MTDDDIIQRPKSRRGNTIDLEPSRPEEPARERKQISFGKRKETSETEGQPKRPSLSFSRKQGTAAEPERAPEPVFATRTSAPTTEESARPRPQMQTQTQAPQKPHSASIDLSGAGTAQRQQNQQRSMDIGGAGAQQHHDQRSMDLSGTSSGQGTRRSVDLGQPGGRPASGGTVDTSAPMGDPNMEAEPAKKRSPLSGIAGAIPFGRREETEDRKGTWGETGYHASDDQAHRDSTYSIPSFVNQTITIFMLQMRLYSKMKWTYFMLFMAILIPVVVAVIPAEIMDMFATMSGTSTVYIGLLLSLMPIFIGFFTAVLCGPSIGREFKDRTAYMNVSLPISRASFYIGKYLAGFVMCLGIFMFAYAMAVAVAMTRFDTFFADLITESLLSTIVSVFVYSATAFCIGSFTRKPSTMTPFVLMTFLLPALFLIVDLRYDVDALMLMPCFLPDASLMVLGAPMVGSVSGFFSMTGIASVDAAEIWTMAGIGVVWGIVFLVLGLIRTMRREM